MTIMITTRLLDLKEFSWMGVQVSTGGGSIPGDSMGLLLSKTWLEIYFDFELF